MKQSILKQAILMASLGAFTIAGYAAINNKALTIKPIPKHERMMLVKPVRVKRVELLVIRGGHRHAHHRLQRSWRRALRPVRLYTPAQARTIAHAAILLYGTPNMKVGSVKPVTTKKGRRLYTIQIVNTRGATIKRIRMNPRNGMMRLIKD